MNLSAQNLPNSAHYILVPMVGCKGIFRVEWNASFDTHTLSFTKESESPVLIATHHNGFSCHELALRMIGGDMTKVNEQREYILACGGMVSTYTLDNIVKDSIWHFPILDYHTKWIKPAFYQIAIHPSLPPWKGAGESYK